MRSMARTTTKPSRGESLAGLRNVRILVVGDVMLEEAGASVEVK